jgi:class 3 adenylate cyclase/tetratricopeptide (TPR) repeat protein
MKCPECHVENRDVRKFCHKCGAKLLLICPECRFENLPGEGFCGECGRNLDERTKSDSIVYSEPRTYTPKFLADKILTTRSAIEGERKLVTVLFADVANYTAMAENLDPEQVHQIMDECFRILMGEIHKYEGTINQFTGDGLMALFGAPVAHEDHAQRACHAAYSIQNALVQLTEKLRNDFGIDFKMRIGINSGPVVVGSIGDDLRMDYTAVGDTTNLASRMESIARPGTVLVSKNTYRIARDFFKLISLGEVQVKGKVETQEIFELRKASKTETRIEAAVAKGLTKFVGRSNSMAALKRAFGEAKSGKGQVVGIVGEAGVGKSRLLLEIRKGLSNEEYMYLEGRCLHFGGSMPYLPVLDILKSYFDIKDGDREFIIKDKMSEKLSSLDDKLKGHLPCIQDILSLRVEDEEFPKLEPKLKREKTFEAIRDLFVRISHERPLVLAVEDLHWIDKTSEDFLDYLIGWLANAKILLIILYRPEYTHPWGSKSYYNRLGLTQLSSKSSEELVQAILEGSKVEKDLKDLILQKTAGNPLFLEELTYTLVENDSILKKGDRYVLTVKPSDIEVPDTVQAIISARMDRLDDNLKRTMQVASVIGRDFAFRILETITGMREELKAHLLNLQNFEFIYEKNLFPELEYIFKHALIQEVAYNSLLSQKRKEIHANIGKAIEHIYSERLEEFYETLAYHYSKSEDLLKAYQYLHLSAEKAAGNHATTEAFGFCKEAVDILSLLPENKKNKEKKLQVLRLITIPMRFLGYPDGSLQFLQEGEALAKEMDDLKSGIIFSSRIGNYFTIKGGNPPLGVQYNEKNFHNAQSMNDLELLARTGWDLCASYIISGQPVKIINVAQKVIDLLETTKMKHESFGTGLNVYSALNAYCGLSLGYMGKFGEGRIFFENGVGFATEIKDETSLGLVEWMYGLFFNAKGDGKGAIEHCQNGIQYLKDVKYLIVLGLAWGCLGHGYLHLGDLETARKYIEKGLEVQSDAGVPWWKSTYFFLLSIVHYDSGRFKESQECIEKAVQSAKQNNEKQWEAYSRVWQGRILSKQETTHVDGTEEYLKQGITVLDSLEMQSFSAQGYFFLGEHYVGRGWGEKGLNELKKAEGMFQEMGMNYWLDKTREALEGL